VEGSFPRSIEIGHLLLWDHMIGGGRAESIQNNEDLKNAELSHQFEMCHQGEESIFQEQRVIQLVCG
jgi:hypothetical protein